MEVMDELIDVVSPPVCYIVKTSLVGKEILTVWHIYSRHRIGIEVVVDMYAIHIVMIEYVFYDHACIETVLWKCGVEDVEPVIFEDTFGVADGRMVGSQFLGKLVFGTVWFNPCVALHLAAMALLHHPGQRIPAVRGRESLRAREVARPRLVRRAVKGIAFSSHLEEDGIDTAPLQAVKLCRQHGTYLRGSLAYILAIDALYPCTTKLTLGVGGREASGTGGEDCR